MAPTLAFIEPPLMDFKTTTQLLGPPSVMGEVGVQLFVHPPNATPGRLGAVNVTEVPTG